MICLMQVIFEPSVSGGTGRVNFESHQAAVQLVKCICQQNYYCHPQISTMSLTLEVNCEALAVTQTELSCSCGNQKVTRPIGSAQKVKPSLLIQQRLRGTGEVQCDGVTLLPFPLGKLDLNTPFQTGKERDSSYRPSQSPFMHITKPLCSLLGAKPALDIKWLKAGRRWEVDLEGVPQGWHSWKEISSAGQSLQDCKSEELQDRTKMSVLSPIR